MPQPSIDEQVAAIMKGTNYGDPQTRQNMENELRQRLQEGRPLRVYLGVDPRTRDLHLGHTVPLRYLRRFQDLGHDAILVIGSFTSLIGDPSDKDVLRPQLKFSEVMSNAETYAEQAFRILDPARTTIRYNHEWLEPLKFYDVIRLAENFTVQQFLTRENFANRTAKGDPIYLHELFYALMQGYDAVALNTDVQIGGTDQLFNMMVAGRKLQQAFGQRPQIAILHGILPGTDGEIRMSKSLGNHIAIRLPPDEMFGKIMSIPDKAMILYYRLLTRFPPEEIDALERDLANGAAHPRDAKMRLGRAIVADLYGPDAAEAAEAEFRRVFQKGELPEQMPEYSMTGPANIVDLIHLASGKSKSEARRLVEQKGVRLDGQVVPSTESMVEPGNEVLQIGKRQFYRLVWPEA